MLKLHVLDQLYRHSSNVAHGVEVPAGARLLFTNGQVGTRPDGVTPGTTAEQTEVAFEKLRAVLRAAGMGFADVVRFNVYFTDCAYVPLYVTTLTDICALPLPGALSIVAQGHQR